MKLFVISSAFLLAIVMTHAAPQAPQREPVPSDVENIERDIQQDQADQAGLETRNHAKRSYGYGGYYGGFGYPSYYGGFGYPYYSRRYYGYGYGYPYYGGFGYPYYGGLYGGYYYF